MVLVNPRAGGGLSERRWAALVGPLTDGLGPFDSRFTERPGHARDLALEEARAGRRLVVALGGDGTISEVADGLIAAASGAELGIIPRGTGGDLRRTLGLPTDLAAAARHVRLAAARTVDAGRATFAAHDGRTAVRHFVNVASFGFSSAVAKNANASSKRFGAKVAFLGATLQSLTSYDNVDVVLTLDGGERQRRTVLLGAIGNGICFGGGMKICPDAILDDGALDIVTVGDLSRAQIVAKIHRLYAGTHTTLHEVSSARTRHLRVESYDPAVRIPIELDGETPGTLPATFEIVPGALKIRF